MLDPVLLRIAKSAILTKLHPDYDFDTQQLLKEYPYLQKNGAAFVTLEYEGQLRGCIGSIVAHQRLLDDILHNAVSAGFSDPRFSSLSLNEISHLSIEVSVLSEPELLEYDDYDDLLKKVTPKLDGLILKHGIYQGTFLPQVWEQLPSPELFLEHLSIKAGSNPSIYNKHPSIYRYRVDAIKDDFNTIQPL